MNNNKNGDYVEFDYPSSLASRLSSKMSPGDFPEIFVGGDLIELNEVCFSSGKGYHNAYSCRPSKTILFDAVNNMHSPLKNKFHKHNYFELMFVAFGKIEMQVESQLCEFRKGDICLLNRSVRHSEHFSSEVKLFYLHLSPEYLQSCLQEKSVGIRQFFEFSKIFNMWLRDSCQQNKDYITFRYNHEETPSPLYEVMAELRKEFEDKKPGYHIFVNGLVYRLFCILSDTAHYQTEHIDMGSDNGFSLAYSAKQILDKYNRRMTKLQIANILSYNSEYINRVFKKHYGYTIPEYNRLVCLGQAAFLLCNTDKHIHEICRQLGFTNRSHFYNLFKHEYGCTPADYRRKQ